MHLIKSGLGLYTYQVRKLLVYLSESLCDSSQSSDIYKLTKLTSIQKKSPSYVQQSFHLHCHQGYSRVIYLTI